jgi:hypothetical protein
MPVSRATDEHGSNIATQKQVWRVIHAVCETIGTPLALFVVIAEIFAVNVCSCYAAVE